MRRLGTPGQGGRYGQTVGHAITLGPQHGTGLLKETQWPQRGSWQREWAMLHHQRKREGCRAGMLEMGRGARLGGGRQMEAPGHKGLPETHPAGRALPPAGGRRRSGAQKGGVQEASPSAPRPCGARARRRRRRAEVPAAVDGPGAADPGPAGGGSRGAARPRPPPTAHRGEAAARARSAEPGRPLRVPRLGGVKREPQPGGGRRGSGACYTASGL